jgi:hypothetical protein
MQGKRAAYESQMSNRIELVSFLRAEFSTRELQPPIPVSWVSIVEDWSSCFVLSFCFKIVLLDGDITQTSPSL